ncbi:hypothetical protein LB523_19015 [Mesorhizobium sp. ESP-6-4]|uniref:hypothetical protein n=1 Tax=Mesorhizobium sp. ESP-6-4 TaxID=2876624 RepID=UPI001CCCAA78|nr:hypothetical protein [Mesorhizobium sp. ESP-6-4]MBZ9661139.1 hypothetical protein [Mesorhizobium sp. ESP-6-4]
MKTVSTTDRPNVSLRDAATLVALALKRTTNKAGQPRIRARMSSKTFKRLTGRRIGGANSAKEFTEELSNLGWLMVRMPSAYGFVRSASLTKWPLTKSNVIAKELEQIGGESEAKALDDARRELGGSIDVGGPSNASDASNRAEGKKKVVR